VGDASKFSREWFERIERTRYQLEPFIHSIAQFTRYSGKELLEIGVGAGTDHLQWARVGARCHGVDLTDAAIETTRAHLETYGFDSDLQRANAETLPFPDAAFDVVYSWGVIHHSEFPERIVQEIHRVLKPGSEFIGMMYGRHSLKVFTAWVYYALLRGRPWRSFRYVLWNHIESAGTKAYTASELRKLFGSFSQVQLTAILTPYDKRVWPKWISQFLPQRLGWFIAIHASK
jgi:ubiquinone/menaquinone biosynthesis C-methylase UbiE